jgi:hypothetical protein
MQLTETTILLNNFNQIVNYHRDEIQEKELKIMLALSDLLEEPDEYEENFINKSLQYLKEKYALDKSVWKVLLKLHDEIPNFAETLSNWEEPGYIGYAGYIDSIYRLAPFNCEFPIKYYGLSENLRQYNLRKVFYFIGLLCKNFTIEKTSEYIGLFIKEFDTRKSPFSMNNLEKMSKDLKEKGEENISTYNINMFFSQFNRQNNLYYTLRKLYYYYHEIKLLKKGSNINNIKTSLEWTFNRMNIPYTDALETFNNIISSYEKYTDKEFIRYQGLIDIKNQFISSEDQDNINYLLKELDKSEKYNEVQTQVFIELIKLTNRYNDNVLKGIDKREIISDYLGVTEDFIQKAATENDFSLHNLTTWSNEWHKKGESRGKKEELPIYNIDMTLDGYVFEQIKDSHKLHEEGKTQSHCVYIYKEKCITGKSIIISMKNNKGERVSTIRLAKENKVIRFLREKEIWYLAENRKRFNKKCSKEEQEVAKKYVSLINDKISSI